ncbi:MAG: PKD domain-containing protein [Acidobacteria bacterium]|nr:PKD domain-containing protein [Acidobacteriota bacterium]
MGVPPREYCRELPRRQTPVPTGAIHQDFFDVERTGANSTVSVNGDDDNDTIRVAGLGLGNNLTVDGGAPVTLPGDTLLFDPGLNGNGDSNATDPTVPAPNSGTIRVHGAPYQVTYTSIESPRIVYPPIASAGGPYTIQEGGSVTLNAGGTQIPFGTPLDQATVEWDLTGDGTFGAATGAAPVVTWADLRSLGIASTGSHSIGVRVTDGQPMTGEADTTLTVQNVAPTIISASAAPTPEGSPAPVTVTASDPGGDNDPLTYQFDFDHDGVYEVSNQTGIAQHVFIDEGTYAVPVRVVDSDGAAVTGTVSVVVSAVPPTLTLSGASSADEGSVYTLGLSAVEPGTDVVTGWTIHWGDGTTDVLASSATSATHVYADGLATYTISATASDEDGIHPAGNTLAVVVNNVAPTLGRLMGVATPHAQGRALPEARL